MSSNFFIPDKPLVGSPDPGGFDSDTSRSMFTPKSTRYSKFSDALSAAAKYKQKAKDEAIIDASIKGKDDDGKGTKGFKISPDTTVVEGYMDPGYTIPGQKGSSLLGTVGAFISPFAPITGQAIGAVGGLTGI